MESGYRFTIIATRGDACADIARIVAGDVAEEILSMLRERHKDVTFELEDSRRVKNLSEILDDSETF